MNTTLFTDLPQATACGGSHIGNSDVVSANVLGTLRLFDEVAYSLIMGSGVTQKCFCHNAGSCRHLCHTTKRRAEMVEILVSKWRAEFFENQAKVARMRVDGHIYEHIREFLLYHVDHPDVSYDVYISRKEIDDILSNINIGECFGENVSKQSGFGSLPVLDWDSSDSSANSSGYDSDDSRNYSEMELDIASANRTISAFRATYEHITLHSLSYYNDILSQRVDAGMYRYLVALEVAVWPNLISSIQQYVTYHMGTNLADLDIDVDQLVTSAQDLFNISYSDEEINYDSSDGSDDSLGVVPQMGMFFKALPDEEMVKDFVENLTFFAQDCLMAKTSVDYMFCIMRFMKVQFGISPIKLAHEWIRHIAQDYTDYMSELHSNVEVQSGFGEFVATYTEVTSSAFWEKSTKLSMMLATLAATYFMGSETVGVGTFRDICSSIYQGLTATEMVGQILEALSAIYYKCIPFIMGESDFKSIFLGVGDGKQLDLDIAHFTTEGSRYIEGTLPGDVQVQPLILQGRAIVNKLQDIMKTCKRQKDREMMRRSCVAVESLLNGVSTKYANSGCRIKPFTLCFHGVTGVGKTCLTLNVGVTLQKALGIEAGSKYMYRKSEDDDYDSSLTVAHNLFLVDDIGQMKPVFTKLIPNEVVIALSNNCPKFANKADLASKGVVPIKPHVVMMTTNDKSLSAGMYSDFPEATLRRIDCHIEVVVKPEYADEGGMLRDDVDPESEGYDCWAFTITHFVKNVWVQTLDYESKPLKEVDYATMCMYLNKRAKLHVLRQERFVNSVETAHLQPFCDCGILLIACKKCKEKAVLEVQSGQYCIQKAAVVRNILSFICGYLIVTVYCLRYHIFERLFGYAFDTVMQWSRDRVVAYVHYNAYVIPTNLVRQYVSEVRDSLLGRRKMVFGVLMTLIGGYGIYTMVKPKVQLQGSTEGRPIAIDVSGLPDVWRKPELAPVPKNDLSVTTTGAQLTKILEPRLCSVYVFDDPKKGHFAVALPLKTNFWLVPYHVVSMPVQFLKIEHAGINTTNYSYTIYREGSYQRIGTTDYAIVYMPNKGDQLDIMRFFPYREKLLRRRLELRDTPALVSMLDRKPIIVEDKEINVPHRFTAGVRVTSSSVRPDGIDHEYWGGSYQCPISTKTGLCGSVLYTPGSGPIIIGFHSAGITGTRNARYCTLMREDIEEVIDNMTSIETPMMQGAETGDWKLDYETMPFEHAIHKRSAFKYIAEAEVDIIGMHTGKSRRNTSQVRPTDYSPRVEELFGVARKHGKPALINHWYPGRVWSEACGHAKPVEMKYLRLAYDDLRAKILTGLEELGAWQDQVNVLDDLATLSGVDGVRGLDKVNLNASAGIPHCKPKSMFVMPSEVVDKSISNPIVLTPDMEEEKNLMLSILKTGRRVYTPHRANRKDEAIKIGKAKVRIFSGTSMPYLFLMRKYFLSLSVFMQKHPELFESAVGVNCYSREWDRLYAYITKYGNDRIIAGDYEKYDQYVANMLTYSAFKLLLTIAQLAGYDEEDLTVMRGLATETCSPVYECEGSWYMFGSSTPSGHGLTVVINGLVNSLYGRIAYYKSRPEGVEIDFRNAVAFMSYGDDNIMSVSEDTPWFTHTSYQGALKEYGLNYTMADKEAETIPYITMGEASFLKRKWVYDTRFNKYMCPLEEDSIHKMLHTMLVSKSVSVEQQLADILRSANQEYFMYPEEVFHERHMFLQTIADEYKLNHYIPGERLPCYADLCVWFSDMQN